MKTTYACARSGLKTYTGIVCARYYQEITVEAESQEEAEQIMNAYVSARKLASLDRDERDAIKNSTVREPDHLR